MIKIRYHPKQRRKQIIEKSKKIKNVAMLPNS